MSLPAGVRGGRAPPSPLHPLFPSKGCISPGSCCRGGGEMHQHPPGSGFGLADPAPARAHHPREKEMMVSPITFPRAISIFKCF